MPVSKNAKPNTKAKITDVYAFCNVSKAKFLSDHFQYHSATYKSYTCNQEPVHRFFLVPLGKKCRRETPQSNIY